MPDYCLGTWLGTWPVAIAAFLIAITTTTRLEAATCGSPPDPRVNTGGYISWCVCMGGVYNTGTTACVGARGPKTGGGAAEGPGFNWPAQHWYCRARASNGANGWARYADRSRAESEAVNNCSQHSGGRACRVVGCSHVGDTAASGEPAAGAANWQCRARASNGASGWGNASSRASAERNALGYCDRYARGSACRIVSCTADGQPVATGSPSAPPPEPPVTSTAPVTAAPPFTELREPTATCGGRICLADQTCGPTNRCYNPNTHFYCGTTRCVKGRTYAAGTACGQCGDAPAQAGRVAPLAPFPFGAQTCDQCYWKLKADIRFGWITGRKRDYILGAISGYENCKQKATGTCTAPDGFRTAVRGCASRSFDDAGSRACVNQVLTNAP